MSALWRRLIDRAPRAAWSDVVFWALDLETSGLEVGQDEILAVGMLPIRDGAIRWGERFSCLVQPSFPGAAIGGGLAAHQLLPAEVAAGLTLAEALDQVLRRLADGVLLVHFAAVDVAFLRAACAACGRPWPKLRVVDTVELLDRLERFEQRRPESATQLGAARARFGLPAVAEHEALTDALSTAELFLVLRHRLRAGTLRELL